MYFTYYNFLFHQTHKQTYPKATPCYSTCVEFQVIIVVALGFANSNRYSVRANWRVKYEKYSNKDFPLIRYENVYLLLLVKSNFNLLNFQEFECFWENWQLFFQHGFQLTIESNTTCTRMYDFFLMEIMHRVAVKKHRNSALAVNINGNFNPMAMCQMSNRTGLMNDHQWIDIWFYCASYVMNRCIILLCYSIFFWCYSWW